MKKLLILAVALFAGTGSANAGSWYFQNYHQINFDTNTNEYVCTRYLNFVQFPPPAVVHRYKANFCQPAQLYIDGPTGVSSHTNNLKAHPNGNSTWLTTQGWTTFGLYSNMPIIGENTVFTAIRSSSGGTFSVTGHIVDTNWSGYAEGTD